MTDAISVVAFRDHTGEILDRVQGGHRYIIQRFTRPVAALVPIADLKRLEDTMAEDPNDATPPVAGELTGELKDLALFLADGNQTEAARLLAQAAADLLKTGE